jgi:RNA-directed DNA polymerase
MRESFRPLLKVSIKLSASDSSLADSFRQLRTFRHIAVLLEVTPLVLHYYLRRSDNYKVFFLRKHSGGKRLICTPVTPLKIIQRKLSQVLYAVYGGRSPAHGFARGKSIVSNASMHLGREYLLNFDLQDFFPSIHFGRVKGLFEGRPHFLPEAVAVTLAQICCHNRILPAGAPTSPIVANMLCAQMDSQLKKLAQECGCTYTRYADDITISVTRGRFPPPIGYREPTTRKWIIGDEIVKIVSGNGFKINPSKTRILPRGYKQEVTGLLVNRRVNVKRVFVRQVRAMLHALEKWGLAAAADEFYAKYNKKQRSKVPEFLRVLRGKIEFIASVRGRDDLIYLRLMDRYLKQDDQARMRPVVVTAKAPDEVVERAIWLLEERGGGVQGTGFAAEGLGMVTAAHVLRPTTVASLPSLSISDVRVTEARRDDHVDVARLSGQLPFPVQLTPGTAVNLRVGDRVRVLGFPLHRAGGSVHIQQGRITGFSPWHGVPHYVVDCPIVHGNSGGPILNERNEVIGIAVKGQGIPKRFSNDDELSRFIPIDFALVYLADP